MAVVDRWPLVEVWLYQEPLALTKHCNEGDPLRRNTPAKGVKKLQTPITWKKIQLIWSHNRSGLLSSETCNQRCPRYQNIDPTKCLRNQLGMVGPFSCVIIIVIIIIFLVIVIDVVVVICCLLKVSSYCPTKTVAPNSHWREMDSDLDKIGWAGPNSSSASTKKHQKSGDQ